MKKFKGLLTTLLLFFAAFVLFIIVFHQPKQIQTVDPGMVEDLKNRGIDIGNGDGGDSIDAIFGGDVLSSTNVGRGVPPDLGTNVGAGMGVPTSIVPSRIAESIGSTTPPSFLMAELTGPYTAQQNNIVVDNVSDDIADDVSNDVSDSILAEQPEYVIPVDESDGELAYVSEGKSEDVSVEEPSVILPQPPEDAPLAEKPFAEEAPRTEKPFAEEPFSQGQSRYSQLDQPSQFKPLPPVEESTATTTFVGFSGFDGDAEDVGADDDLHGSVRFTTVESPAPLLCDVQTFSAGIAPEPSIPSHLPVTAVQDGLATSIAAIFSDTENRMDPVIWHNTPAPVPMVSAVPVHGGVRDTVLMFDDQIFPGTDLTPIRVSVVNLANQYRENVQSGNVLEGFSQLTQLYTHPQLRSQERRMMLPPLDQLAGKVIYDRTVHLLEPPYIVQPEDTVESIAATYCVTPQLLININRLDIRRPLRANDTLKVLRGPFHVVMDPSNYEIQVFLNSYYAGRFRFGSSLFPFSETGTYPIRQKRLLTAAAGTSSTTRQVNNNSPVRDQSHVFGWFTFGDKGMVIATANPKLIGTNQLSQEGYCMTEGDMRDVFCLLTADSTLTFPP